MSCLNFGGVLLRFLSIQISFLIYSRMFRYSFILSVRWNMLWGALYFALFEFSQLSLSFSIHKIICLVLCFLQLLPILLRNSFAFLGFILDSVYNKFSEFKFNSKNLMSFLNYHITLTIERKKSAFSDTIMIYVNWNSTINNICCRFVIISFLLHYNTF